MPFPRHRIVASSPRGHRRRRQGLAAAAVVAMSTAVIATAASGSPGPGPRRYVALGDSFTSGPALPAQLGPATRPAAPAACRRSSADYPALTAAAKGLSLVDMSCGGATTADLVHAQGPGIPPQLAALGPTTAVVSVGIGGNDLGFAAIVANCVAVTPWGGTRVGWGCRSHYTAGGTDRLAAALDTVAARVAAALRAIRDRAPHARVFVVGYPDILPPAGPGCWPALPFSAGDVAYLRTVAAGLDATLARAAAGAGDTYVDTATPSADHSVCSADDSRWVNSALPGPHRYPLHPTAAGMRGAAHALERALAST